MLISIHHENRIYRIECPDHSRIYRNPPDLEDCLVIPDSEDPEVTEKSRFLLTPFAIAAAKRGDYELTLLPESEAG